MGYAHGTKRGGIDGHPLMNVYSNMISRCYSKNRWNYKYYGGRGIKVCERWSNDSGFLNFIKDMGERPDNYQLDRIDVNKDYSPDNCRWVDKYTQMANTRRNNKHVGVGWHNQRNKWRARIKVNGKEISLGLFSGYDEAVNARIIGFKKYAIQ